VRYRADGLLDESFGTNGISSVAGGFTPYRHAVQPDGKIVVAGGSSDFVAARFNSDGSPDSTFGIGGVLSPTSSTLQIRPTAWPSRAMERSS
jgi:uncharacterized delta-60 repeat protein